MTRFHSVYKGLLFVFLIFGSGRVAAQQNLFNIPAGDVTPKNKFFFQQQTNIYHINYLEAKNHLVYGLGGGFEVGLNVVNLKMDFRQQAATITNGLDYRVKPMSPLMQLTAQKFFFLNERFKTSIGTQIGTKLARLSANPGLTHFTYNIWVYEPRHHVKVVVGPYFTDRGTVGAGSRAGLLVGVEYPLAKRLLLMGDFVSGNNASSVSVIGFNFLANKRVQLCLGALLPNPGTANKPGVVFELNLLGSNDSSH